MSKKNNRTCICCGIEYRYCPSCTEDNNKPTWFRNFHDENCKKIFYVVNDYVCGDIDAVIANERLNKCDLSIKKSIKKSIRVFIDEITEKASKTLQKENTVKKVSKKQLNSD